MALPTIIASNQTAGALFLSRLGLTVPASGTLTLTDYAFVQEIYDDETLYAYVAADDIRLDFGQGELTPGEGIKWWNIITSEVKIPVRLIGTANVAALSGTGTLVDGVAVAADDRVLLTAQTVSTQNGVWSVKAGAWQRPDDLGTGQSAHGALIVSGPEGTDNANELWQCITALGNDVVGTNGLAFTQTSGGGGGSSTLQQAYVAGNTITTDATNGDVIFTGTEDFLVTLSDVNMDVTGTLVFDASTSITMGGDADDSAINIGTGTTNGRAITIGNATGTTGVDIAAGSGDITLDSNSGNITLDATAGAISLDAAAASNFSVTGAGIDLTLASAGGRVVVDGGEAAADAVTISATNAAGGIDVNAGTGGITLDSTGAISLDGVGGSNFNTDSGNLTFATTTSGSITADGIDGVAINSSAGDINIGDDADDGQINIGTASTTGRDITIGNATGTTSVTVLAGTGDITLDATETIVTGNLTVQGTTTTVESETVLIADNHLYLNDGYTAEAAQTGGLVVNYDPIATEQTVVDTGGFTAGVAATSNPTVRVTDASGFATGDFIQVSGSANPENDGLYEVLSIDTGADPDIVTIRGIGLTGTVEDFTQNQFTTDTTVQGTVTHVNVSVMRSGTDGIWEYAYGNATALTFYDVLTNGGATGVTLQIAYEGGNTITTNATDGSVIVAGTESLQVTATGGINLDTVFDADVTSFDVQLTGNNGFSIDGTADSNLTVTNTAATTDTTLTITADNQGATSGNALVDINATSTNGTGTIEMDADDTIDLEVLSGGAINIGTDAVANTTTIGNNTGATEVIINSGTEMVVVDGVTYYGKNAGAPTPTGAGFADGDKYYDTNLDMEMRYDATRVKWLSVESMTLQWGRNGNTGAGVYYRGTDGRVLSDTIGYAMPHAGTIVASGYTRSDSDLAVIDYMEDGVSRATHTMTVTAGTSDVVTNLNGNFSAGGVLAVMNQAGSNTTADVSAWVKVKWRV